MKNKKILVSISLVLALGLSVFAVADTSTSLKLGDTNGDGSISAADALEILQYSVGKIDNFSAEESSNPTVSVEEALNCLEFFLLSDDTEFKDDTNTEFKEWQFIFDFVLLESENAKFPVKSAKVLNATVDGGRECQIIQSTTTTNAQYIATKGDFISDVTRARHACRVISPFLNVVGEIDDVTIEIQIEFENGAITNVKYIGSQSNGKGGATGFISDSDYE